MCISGFRQGYRLRDDANFVNCPHPAPVRIHAETAWRMMSARDPWTNILRSTIAAAAAGIGGADAISLIITIYSLMGVDLETWIPIPLVDG